jgi:hypothetical protein
MQQHMVFLLPSTFNRFTIFGFWIFYFQRTQLWLFQRLVSTKFDIYVFIMMYKTMYSPECMMLDTLVYHIAVSRIRTIKD